MTEEQIVELVGKLRVARRLYYGASILLDEATAHCRDTEAELQCAQRTLIAALPGAGVYVHGGAVIVRPGDGEVWLATAEQVRLDGEIIAGSRVGIVAFAEAKGGTR